MKNSSIFFFFSTRIYCHDNLFGQWQVREFQFVLRPKAVKFFFMLVILSSLNLVRGIRGGPTFTDVSIGIAAFIVCTQLPGKTIAPNSFMPAGISSVFFKKFKQLRSFKDVVW